MISIYTQIAHWCWPILFLVWLVGYFNTKTTLRRPRMGVYLGTSILIALGFTFLFGAHNLGMLGTPLTPQNSVLGILGDILCVSGIFFAIWARITLGSNWSGTIATVKKGHELIRHGPYAFVRHPIYTGFFFGMLGTALTIGTFASYLGVVLGLAAFLIRIRIEEEVMTEEFSEMYLEYKKSVKGLVPFVW